MGVSILWEPVNEGFAPTFLLVLGGSLCIGFVLLGLWLIDRLYLICGSSVLLLASLIGSSLLFAPLGGDITGFISELIQLVSWK